MSPVQDSHDFATRRQLVRSVVQDVGPSLVAGVLKACLFDIPRSMICHSTEVFYELLSTDRAVSPRATFLYCSVCASALIRAVQPVATCRRSSYLHKPAIAIVTSFSL